MSNNLPWSIFHENACTSEMPWRKTIICQSMTICWTDKYFGPSECNFSFYLTSHCLCFSIDVTVPRPNRQFHITCAFPVCSYNHLSDIRIPRVWGFRTMRSASAKLTFFLSSYIHCTSSRWSHPLVSEHFLTSFAVVFSFYSSILYSFFLLFYGLMISWHQEASS